MSNGQIPRKKDGVAGVNNIRASADNDDDTSDTFDSSMDSLIHYVNLIWRKDFFTYLLACIYIKTIILIITLT